MGSAERTLRDRAETERMANETRLHERDLTPRERARRELVKAAALGQD